jgi:hypothetical protein
MLQWLSGSGYSAIVRTRSGSISTPSRVIMKPTKLILRMLNSHYDSLR